MTETSPITFNSLYTKYYSKAYRFVKSYVHDELASEDIVSESLIRLWDHLKEEPQENFLPLLITILKNKSLDYLKHERIKWEAHKSISQALERELDIRISTLHACDPNEIFSQEIQNLVQTTLSSLPVQTRKVFELSRYENKSGKEIAEELNMTVKGVEYHMTKALKAFRISLKDYFPFWYFFI